MSRWSVSFLFLVPFWTMNCVAKETQSQPVQEAPTDYLSAVKGLSPPLGSDYQAQLCGNYRIVRTNAHEVTIIHPEGRLRPIVAGNVRKLAIKAPYVAGYTTVLTGDERPDAKTEAGYFLLNTATEKMKRGLSEQKWRSELQHIGWRNPQLTQPL